MTLDKEKVRRGIKSAVKPSYDNGEWALWCGEKEWAEAVLEAARAWLDGQDKPDHKDAEIERLKALVLEWQKLCEVRTNDLQKLTDSVVHAKTIGAEREKRNDNR